MPAVQCSSACVNKLAAFIAGLVLLPGSLSCCRSPSPSPLSAALQLPQIQGKSGSLAAEPRGWDCSPDRRAGFGGLRSSSLGSCCSEMRFLYPCARGTAVTQGTRMLTQRAARLCAGALTTTLSTDSHPEEPKSGTMLTHHPATAAFSAPPLSVPLSALPSSLLPRVSLLRAPHRAAAMSPGRARAAPRSPPGISAAGSAGLPLSGHPRLAASPQ